MYAMSALQAAWEGTHEVAVPLCVSTATFIVVDNLRDRLNAEFPDVEFAFDTVRS